MTGYIKDHRKELESDIWLMPPLYHRVWQWLKYKANHQDKSIPMKDGSKITIRRGQHMTSIRQIAQGVGWYENGKWKEPNPKTIKSILDWMKQQGMINITGRKGNNGYTLITLINWEVYQSKDEEGNNEHPIKKQSTDINKNDKNDKNDKKDINNTRRKQRRVYDEDSPYYKMAVYFRQKIEENVLGYIFRGNIQTWADDFRKIHEIDGRTKQEIKEVIDWVTQDDFWQDNVQSPSKLRKQFHVLMNRMRKEQERGGGRGVGYQGHYGTDRKDETPIINFGKYANFGRRVGG
ncbi:hypothetical protein JQC72_14940 [Polycladomyces sp. WAk]|uniref:LAGLIDADG endonuclease n=1 Tax=Polycladomyces zharkentensis TaxID=2807616 RepID=A0ABS2WMP9_9BACL|nr:hypothetical protein [Polycladomyces sp. WAk]